MDSLRRLLAVNPLPKKSFTNSSTHTYNFVVLRMRFPNSIYYKFDTNFAQQTDNIIFVVG